MDLIILIAIVVIIVGGGVTELITIVLAMAGIILAMLAAAGVLCIILSPLAYAYYKYPAICTRIGTAFIWLSIRAYLVGLAIMGVGSIGVLIYIWANPI